MNGTERVNYCLGLISPETSHIPFQEIKRRIWGKNECMERMIEEKGKEVKKEGSKRSRNQKWKAKMKERKEGRKPASK